MNWLEEVHRRQSWIDAEVRELEYLASALRVAGISGTAEIIEQSVAVIHTCNQEINDILGRKVHDDVIEAEKAFGLTIEAVMMTVIGDKDERTDK